MPVSTALVEKWKAESDDEIVADEVEKLVEALNAKFAFSEVDVPARKALNGFVVTRGSTCTARLRRALLSLLRILARDHNIVEQLFDPALSRWVAEESGLVQGCVQDDFSVIMEASKCLINALFNSATARTAFEQSSLTRLLARLNVLRRFVNGEHGAVEEDDGDKVISTANVEDVQTLWFFDLRLAFIASAHLKSLQTAWRESSLCLDELETVVTEALDEEGRQGRSRTSASPISQQNHLARANEALKILFNLFCHAKDVDVELVARMSRLCVRILNEASEKELRQNTINLLAALPLSVDVLCPLLTAGANVKEHYEGVDLTTPSLVLDDLIEKLDNLSDSNTRDLLGTYFTVLIKVCKDSPAARRHIRLKVLPPLRAEDVEHRPDEGDSARGRLARVLQSPSNCKELVEEFLFILCKRSVARMIKYTGFGLSAGFLANHSLLGAVNEPRNPNDSEDSETEDYKAVKDEVNPVTGARDKYPRVSPLDGMSEEQKEYEAMKLVNAMDKLMSTGVISPATIGEDGKARAVSHVLELTKDMPDPKAEDSDSD